MIDYIINRHLDPNALDPLRGAIIAINCTDLSKTWYLLIEDKLYIVDSAPLHIDVTLSSSVAGFLQYILRQDRSDLHLTGNVGIAEKVQQLVAGLDIDWEEELSKYTGDVFAHQIVRFLQQLRSINLDQMIAEYLQEESKILPGKHEIREFLNNVDVLRQDVDRLDAKIKVYALNN